MREKLGVKPLKCDIEDHIKLNMLFIYLFWGVGVGGVCRERGGGK
jgi:hypothetical protein